MWLSEKTVERDRGTAGGCIVGCVSIGGVKPSVIADGEQRSAELICGGVVYVPKAGDEVLMTRDCEGGYFVLGLVAQSLPDIAAKGEVYITNGSGGHVRVRSDGVVELSGPILMTGRTEIEGELLINGEPYVRPVVLGGAEDGA